jgi:hypothetical protein
MKKKKCQKQKWKVVVVVDELVDVVVQNVLVVVVSHVLVVVHLNEQCLVVKQLQERLQEAWV